MSQLIATIENLVLPLFEKAQVELVDLEYMKEPAGWTLRFYLDKPGGFNLADCENWSHQLGPLLDEANIIDRSYNLEISSPGLDRPIKKTADFKKYAGERVRVKLYAPVDNQRNFQGTLLGGDEKSIRLKLEEGREVDLPRNLIARARLNPIIEI